MKNILKITLVVLLLTASFTAPVAPIQAQVPGESDVCTDAFMECATMCVQNTGFFPIVFESCMLGCTIGWAACELLIEH